MTVVTLPVMGWLVRWLVLLPMRDERAATRLSLEQIAQELQLITDNCSDIILRFDRDLRRVYVSPAVLEMLGVTPETFQRQAHLDGVHPDDRDRVVMLLNRLRNGAPMAEITYRRTRPDGRVLWLEEIWRRLDQPAGGYVAMVRDVTRRRRTEDWVAKSNKKLRLLASLDSLTDLANRRQFDTVLEAEFDRAMRGHGTIGLIVLDIDHFKSFNDRHGHPAGDAALKLVAEAVRGALRTPRDVAARYGGEEFAVVLPDATLDESELVASRICSAVRQMRLELEDGGLAQLTLSAGVAASEPTAELASAAELLANADRALYAAKLGGRDRLSRAVPDGN